MLTVYGIVPVALRPNGILQEKKQVKDENVYDLHSTLY